MTKVLINDQSLYDIADSIRGKLGVETLYLPSDMADAIESIETGTDLTSEDEGKVVVEDSGSYVLAEQTSLSVSQNGTYDTTTNDEVVVDVSGGGGSSTPEIVEVTINTSVVSNVSGKVLVVGKHAHFSGRVDFKSSSSDMKHVMTVPEGYRPYGYRALDGGAAGSSTRDSGYIGSDGKVYVAHSGTYTYISLDWVIADETYNVTYDSSVVSECHGGVSVSNGMASLDCLLKVTPSTSKWYDQIITLPQALGGFGGCIPVARYASSLSTTTVFAFVDTLVNNDGDAVGVFLNSSYNGKYIFINCEFAVTD